MEILKKIATKNDVAVAVIVRYGKVLLGNRVYPDGKSIWTFPGGQCEVGETIEEGLYREVLEEIGISRDSLQIVKFIGNSKGSRDTDVVHLFYSTIVENPTNMEPEKFKKWSWFTINEINRLHLNAGADDEVLKMVKSFLINQIGNE